MDGCDHTCQWEQQYVSCSVPYPAYSEINTVDHITQTWNGSSRTPSNTSIYSTTASTTECHFQCMSNYTRDAGTSTCVANTQLTSCTTKPSNTYWNTVSSITQTWNGSSRAPDNTSAYNTSASTTTCNFACNSNYTRNGSSCVANTQLTSCTTKPANTSWNTVSSITQTWNGSSRAPTNTSAYNTSASIATCNYQCSTGYTRNAGTTTCDVSTYISTGSTRIYSGTLTA